MPGVFTQQPFTGVETRRNLAPNPKCGVDTTGWAASASSPGTAVMERIGTGGGILPAGVTSRSSARCTAAPIAAGGYLDTRALGIPVTALTTISVSGYVYYSAGASLTTFIQWKDAGGVAIGNVTVAQPTAPATWSRVTFGEGIVVPAGAAQMDVIARAISSAGAPIVVGSFVGMTAVLSEVASAVGPYFDGDTIDTDTVHNRWVGAANASASRMLVPLPAEQIKPLFGPTAPTDYASESSMIVHELMDDPSVTWLTYRPAKRRKGDWRLLFDTEAAAVDAVNRFPGWGTLSFDGDGRTALAVSRFVVPAGESVTMRPVQELVLNSTGDQWLYEVIVPWREVSP